MKTSKYFLMLLPVLGNSCGLSLLRDINMVPVSLGLEGGRNLDYMCQAKTYKGLNPLLLIPALHPNLHMSLMHPGPPPPFLDSRFTGSLSSPCLIPVLASLWAGQGVCRRVTFRPDVLGRSWVPGQLTQGACS